MSGSGATGAASGIAVATVVAKVATWDFANRASPFFIQRRKNLTQNERKNEMQQTAPPSPPQDAEHDDGGGDGCGPFLILMDAREKQPDERLQTDGRMDHPTVALVGCENGLTILFSTGVLTPPETEGPFTMYIDRDRLAEAWPFLTRFVETGEWKPDLPPHPQLPSFKP